MAGTNIAENVEQVRERIAAAAVRSGRRADAVTLVAVSKFQPAEALRAVLDAGIRHVGENYVPEAEAKFAGIAWPEGVTKHFIGHLQGNKSARAMAAFNIIQSVDSLKLAKRLDSIAEERAIIYPILMEARLCDEPEKTGFTTGELPRALDAVLAMEHLHVRGLMGMAPFTEDKELVRSAFRTLQNHFVTLHNDNRLILSMGMTNDLEIAIEEGSTMVRVGTALFGSRHP